MHLPERKHTLGLIITCLPDQCVDSHSLDRHSDRDIVSGILKIVIPNPRGSCIDIRKVITDVLKFAKKKYFNGYSETRSVQENFNLTTSFIQRINTSLQKLVVQFPQSHG